MKGLKTRVRIVASLVYPHVCLGKVKQRDLLRSESSVKHTVREYLSEEASHGLVLSKVLLMT